MLLQIDGEIDVRDAAITKRRAARQMSHLFDVRRSHDSGVVDRDVHEDTIEVDVLLRMSINQIMIVMPRDRQHRLAVKLGVIESIQ